MTNKNNLNWELKSGEEIAHLVKGPKDPTLSHQTHVMKAERASLICDQCCRDGQEDPWS